MYNRLTLKKLGTKSLKAPIFLFFTLSFFLPKLSKGQGIDSTGKFVPSKSNDLYDPKIMLSPPTPKRDTVAEKETKKILLEKVEKTILRLEDDSTYLKFSYVKIWGKDFFETYLFNLRLLREYLKLGTHIKQEESLFLPHIDEIKDIIKPHNFTLKEGKKQNGTKEFLLFRKDLLAKYLLDEYTKDYKDDEWVRIQEINAEYLSNWRKLESWFTLTGKLHKKLETMEQNIFDFDLTDISAISEQIKKVDPNGLPLTKWIKTSPIVQNWLWFNEGDIRINPLPSTVKDKRYPNEEPNLFFGPVQKKLQDSLEKLKAFENFAVTTKTFNKIILPIKSEDRPDTLMIQYNMVGDSLKRVTADTNKFKDGYIKDKLQLVIPVYNIPENKRVLMDTDKKDLIYESRAITEINVMAEKLGLVTSLGLSNSATITKISNLLNIQPLPLGRINFDENNNKMSLNADIETVLKKTDKGLNTSIWTGVGGQPVTAVQIGSILVRLTNKDLKEDKKRILWTSQFGKDNIDSLKDISPLFEKLLQAFVEDDRYFFLDYSSMNNIKLDINKMINRFNAFKNKIVIRLQEISNLKTLNSGNNELLVAYLRINQRSLPPEILKEKTDTAAMYYTKIFVPEIPSTPKTLTYTINEGTVGTAKLKEVDKLEFKRVKTQLFDLSVGIGYTFSDYNITSNTGSDLPTTELGDKFQFQAGLHWYFVNRLNKLNDRIFKNTDERFSLYVGLSLKKALENYYTGISYDIVPGVKLIVGAHFYKNNRFKIINNAVAEKASGISYAGLFTSLNLEPITIGKAIGLFK
ncbi:hypothetical protein J7E50_06945 [Pedobacter sp. ISL-68]|uniref:hypothetical protein n=1 Tax=unclassified Pedobacter TaxID=2628915 RepID=UPI001BEA4B29|nr:MULTISPECIES: hypothetical protein [unclassified Pedobacter]MBT2560568.1 hypothetical protein [Pedobacter sp. ISL-64]MBT2589947.1 hypothetical protein [Pedobacter sp. ISL-68]